MSDREKPELYAWVDEANAEDAYLATLSTLYDPAVFEDERMHVNESEYWTSPPKYWTASDDELLSMREVVRRKAWVGAYIPIILRPQDMIISVDVMCRFPSHHRSGVPGCLISVDQQQNNLVPEYAKIALSQGELSVPVSAAILGRFGQENLDKVFLGMCAPDGHARVRAGAYQMLDKLFEWNVYGNGGWRAPLEMAATYHGDRLVARDVALSWLYLHDGGLIIPYLDLSLDALIARVEAAPPKTTVGISSQPIHVAKHGLDEWKNDPDGYITLVNNSRGPRPRFPEDEDLTREQVLATLRTPSETLLQALEAVAVPDPEWIEAEKQALDVLAADKEGELGEFVKIDQLEQRNFLEAHAPYHVRRLPNGGVMLATHPYRYLWSLWAKALDLLGIRKLTR